MVWVHGDQLIMAPFYLRRQFAEANIGFYFHSAFPASAIFHSLYRRKEMLQSLLHSDLIGFHLFEFARNFVNTCHRTLGLQTEFSVGGVLSVNYHNRNIVVHVSHIGIDEDFIESIMKSSAYRKHIAQFNAEFKELTARANRHQA